MSRKRELPGSRRFRFKLQTRPGPYHLWFTRSYKHESTRDERAKRYRELGWPVVTWNYQKRGEMSDYELVLPFDTDNSEFVRGVEVGRLWETMKATPEEFEQTVHLTNAEMVIRMGEAQNRTVQSKELDDIWMSVTFGEAESAG